MKISLSAESSRLVWWFSISTILYGVAYLVSFSSIILKRSSTNPFEHLSIVPFLRRKFSAAFRANLSEGRFKETCKGLAMFCHVRGLRWKARQNVTVRYRNTWLADQRWTFWQCFVPLITSSAWLTSSRLAPFSLLKMSTLVLAQQTFFNNSASAILSNKDHLMNWAKRKQNFGTLKRSNIFTTTWKNGNRNRHAKEKHKCLKKMNWKFIS